MASENPARPSRSQPVDLPPLERGCGGSSEACEARSRGEPVVKAVLEATLDELAVGGFAGLSVEKVAERARVNKTTVYRRYPTKGDLVAAAMFHHKQASLTLPDTGTLRGDLTAMLMDGARYMSEARGKCIFRMLLCERQNPDLSSAMERLKKDGERSPRLVLQRAIARGELDPETDLELMMHTLFGPIIHRVFLENDVFTSDEAERLVDIVLHGVLRRPTP